MAAQVCQKHATKKEKQKTTTKALPAPIEDEDQDEPDLGPSKAHWIKVHDALARIFSHELFKDILTADPLSVKDGGREAALDATQAASALKNAGVYKVPPIFSIKTSFSWPRTKCL